MNLLELGARANAERERRHGNRVYFSMAPVDVVHVECEADRIEETLRGIGPARAVAVSVRAEAGHTTGEAEIRAIALARLLLDAEHIVADVGLLTPYVAQVALRFGADQLAGFAPGTAKKEIQLWIAEAGREPFECDANYEAFVAAESPLAVLSS